VIAPKCQAAVAELAKIGEEVDRQLGLTAAGPVTLRQVQAGAAFNYRGQRLLRHPGGDLGERRRRLAAELRSGNLTEHPTAIKVIRRALKALPSDHGRVRARMDSGFESVAIFNTQAAAAAGGVHLLAEADASRCAGGRSHTKLVRRWLLAVPARVLDSGRRVVLRLGLLSRARPRTLSRPASNTLQPGFPEPNPRRGPVAARHRPRGQRQRPRSTLSPSLLLIPPRSTHGSKSDAEADGEPYGHTRIHMGDSTAMDWAIRMQLTHTPASQRLRLSRVSYGEGERSAHAAGAGDGRSGTRRSPGTIITVRTAAAT
jgi:hypothetical protein